MQIVGYDVGVGGPAGLLVSDAGDVRRERLAPGDDLAYALGERHCAGDLDGETHETCEASASPFCPDHTSSWPCARCSGDCGLPLEACREEHAVYLAAFAPDAFKVGVTRSWRLDRRLREQGADRAAHLHTVSDGRIAREIEAEIAADVGDSVRVTTKVDGLHRTVDREAWRAVLDDRRVVDEFDFDYGLDLDVKPIPATLAAGTVLGTKGRALVLDADATTYAVDLRDLVGHEVDAGPPGRDRQASLGAFE